MLDVESNKMADKKNIVPIPLTLAILSGHIVTVSLGGQQYDKDDYLLYILYFKDRAVFSFNANGAFSDGIIRAVS